MELQIEQIFMADTAVQKFGIIKYYIDTDKTILRYCKTIVLWNTITDYY